MKQRISRWFVDAITLAYSSLGLQCPNRVRAIPSEASPLPGHGPAGCSFQTFVRRPGGPRLPYL